MGKCASKEQPDGDEEESCHFHLSGGNVHLVTTKEEWEGNLSKANEEGRIVLANFSATWCGPCKAMAPYFSELSVEYTSLIFLIVDVDELSDLSTSYEIKATPSIFFLKDGQQVDKLVGSNKAELLNKITAILDSEPQEQDRHPQPQ